MPPRPPEHRGGALFSGHSGAAQSGAYVVGIRDTPVVLIFPIYTVRACGHVTQSACFEMVVCMFAKGSPGTSTLPGTRWHALWIPGNPRVCNSSRPTGSHGQKRSTVAPGLPWSTSQPMRTVERVHSFNSANEHGITLSPADAVSTPKLRQRVARCVTFAPSLCLSAEAFVCTRGAHGCASLRACSLVPAAVLCGDWPLVSGQH